MIRYILQAASRTWDQEPPHPNFRLSGDYAALIKSRINFAPSCGLAGAMENAPDVNRWLCTGALVLYNSVRLRRQFQFFAFFSSWGDRPC